MMAVFAEFERAMIRERVTAGLARARAQGKRLGGPKVNEQIEVQIKDHMLRGAGIWKNATELNVGTSVVQRIKA